MKHHEYVASSISPRQELINENFIQHVRHQVSRIVTCIFFERVKYQGMDYDNSWLMYFTWISNIFHYFYWIVLV